jgi:hypothetical protein
LSSLSSLFAGKRFDKAYNARFQMLNNLAKFIKIQSCSTLKPFKHIAAILGIFKNIMSFTIVQGRERGQLPPLDPFGARRGVACLRPCARPETQLACRSGVCKIRWN